SPGASRSSCSPGRGPPSGGAASQTNTGAPLAASQAERASPPNPGSATSAMASAEYLARALSLARQYDFMLFCDECYSEIYTGAPPPGGLQVAAATPERFRNLVCFNSLSKRSNVPGLRSGYAAGDGDFLETMAEIRNLVAPQMPGPQQHASVALWADDTHVQTIRSAYNA
ncbi:MAG: aminotransferase class I/II-fold pyridoxal phosphate-dependent enzyme, partial [Pseudomonadota bacterium]